MMKILPDPYRNSGTGVLAEAPSPDIEELERLFAQKTVTQDYIDSATPMGANLTRNGATFRLWAPMAKEVYVVVGKEIIDEWRSNPGQHLDPSKKLSKRDDLYGHWTGFLEGVNDGDHYQFYIVGNVTTGFKRDPCARELSKDPSYPKCNCIIRNPGTYPWQDAGYTPPAYQDFIIYQLHIGTFLGSKSLQGPNKFLDVLDKIEYLSQLGINAIQLMPITEFSSPRSKGYDGSDGSSPEMDYEVDSGQIDNYLQKVNRLFQARNKGTISREVLENPISQLKVLIDICHAHGIAVLFDIVYNHIGSDVPNQDESIWMLDRFDFMNGDPNHSPHFTNETWTGYCFALWKQEVQQFLINNAVFFVQEYHVDGFRYDETSQIIAKNKNNGWEFCQHITDTVRFVKPSVFQVSENWPVDPWIVKNRPEGGANFDSCWNNGLRDTLRTEIANAARGRDSFVNMTNIRNNLYPANFPLAWKAVQYLESHDEVKINDNNNYLPRIAKLADGSNPRSWYARSRSRVAMGILMTAAGNPMMFMGQEFLSENSWSDNTPYFKDSILRWESLDQDPHMRDFLKFTQDLIWLRRKHPALRSQQFGETNGYYVHDMNRIMAYQRYIAGIGRDVIVVVSLNESTFPEYQLGFPYGLWYVSFNADYFDSMQDGRGNPWCVGNAGQIYADGPPMDNMPSSAKIVIPANSVLVFTRDHGD